MSEYGKFNVWLNVENLMLDVQDGIADAFLQYRTSVATQEACDQRCPSAMYVVTLIKLLFYSYKSDQLSNF